MRLPRFPSRNLLSRAGERRVVEAIRRAERLTSGEIRVHVEERCLGDALDAARRWFDELGMTRTAERNGVLLYLAVLDRKFAIVGDEGIHSHVGEAFWVRVGDRMAEQFRAGEIARGLEEAILAVGFELARAFPRGTDDRNELEDALSRDGRSEAQDE